MYKSSLTIAEDIAQPVREAKDKAPGLMNQVYLKRTLKPRQQLLNRLRQSAGKPHYPLRWASDRQRKKYFASRGFGEGIPYVRTEDTANAWQVQLRRLGDRDALSVINPEPHSIYLYGDALGFHQQPFHKDTGWVNANDEVANYQPIFEGAVIEAWVETHDILLEMERR